MEHTGRRFAIRASRLFHALDVVHEISLAQRDAVHGMDAIIVDGLAVLTDFQQVHPMYEVLVGPDENFVLSVMIS